jgi:hypothetical protein
MHVISLKSSIGQEEQGKQMPASNSENCMSYVKKTIILIIMADSNQLPH